MPDEHTACEKKNRRNSPKRRTFSTLHGVTTHKTALFVVAAVRASNPVFIDSIINLINLQSLVFVLKYTPSLILPSNPAKFPIHQHSINRMHEFLVVILICS